MMTYRAFSNQQTTCFSKRTRSMLCATFLSLFTMGSAYAMLPTPEPELDAPSNSQNATMIQQASGNGASQAVSTKVSAFLVGLGDDGQPLLVPVTASTQLQKGNVIEYQGYFTNISADNQRKMTVTMSIPDEVKLVNIISPDYPLASVDGKKFHNTPLRGRIGNEIQEIPIEYYKALRWDIEGLALGKTAVVKYQAIVR